MDVKPNVNQPSPSAPVQQSGSSAPAPRRGGNPKKLLAVLVSLVVVVALAVAAVTMLGGKASGDAAIEKDKYQALFMTNGQVYFGKLSGLESGYTELTDVYYLQVQQSVQPSTGNNAQNNTPQTQQAQGANGQDPQVSLTKLGNELHGPTDKMHISRDQVLFWENLKDDSTVVKAIKEYQAKQN